MTNMIFNILDKHINENDNNKDKTLNYIDIGLDIWEWVCKNNNKYNLRCVNITYQNQDRIVLKYDRPNGIVLTIPIERYESKTIE